MNNNTTPSTDGKSKRGRKKKVHFEVGDTPDEPTFNFSAKSDGKAQSEPIFGKGDSAKGGKGSRAANKVNTAAPKEPLQLKIDPELMKNAEYLLDSEAANILMRIQEQMIDLSKDSEIKLPVTFDKGLQYAKGSTQLIRIPVHPLTFLLSFLLHAPPSVTTLNSNFRALKVHGVTDGEMCVLANVCPETVDEVFALIPSLKLKWHVLREPLVNVLSRLANLRKRT
ncbi:hypothetical protein ACFE04_030135 [Oxalis oulophora]